MADVTARFRLPADLWEQFDAESRRANSDRSKELRKFVEWYLGRPGARPVHRPLRKGDAEA